MKALSYFVSILLLIPMLSCATPRVLILGDSISANYGINEQDGWVTLLRHKLQQKYPDAQVFNDSISGSTTSNGLQRLPKALTKYQPTVVIIELGGNDALRGFPIAVIRKNLIKLVQYVKKQNSKVLLAGITIPPNYGPSYRNQFEAVFDQVAKAENIAVIPQILNGIVDDKALMQQDGIHPNQYAQVKILARIWPALVKLLSNEQN